MSHKRITSVEVTNFMVYKHAKISFNEENIINIKGYNSGGKSTMLKAIAVCLMNMYSKSQAKFIRHGEKYFRIVVSFEDGVSILRDKYINGQSLYEIYKDGKCVYTTKEGNKLTKIDGIPDAIMNYLGLCIVSTGCLNYQVRQDPLWLIETKGSENYNSLNEILKTEEISRANALLNSDKNGLGTEIAGIEASLQEVKLSLADAEYYTEELLSKMEEKESYCKELTHKYRDVKDLCNIVENLQGIKDIPDVSIIELGSFKDISSILDTATAFSDLVIPPEVEVCDTKRLSMLKGITSNVDALKEVDSISPNVDIIDYNNNIMLENIVDIIKNIQKVSKDISTLKEENTKHLKKLKSIASEAKKQGIKFVQCENCGTYMEVKT